MDVGLTVRVAIEDDAQTAIEVIRRSISELCTADHHGDPEALAQWLANKTAAHFRTWLASPGQYTVVAERDGTLCGVGMLGADGEVRLCYVHPEHARGGVGRALVVAMEDRARARGLVRLHLDATLSAISFYEAMGFQRAGSSSAGLDATGTNPYDKQIDHRVDEA